MQSVKLLILLISYTSFLGLSHTQQIIHEEFNEAELVYEGLPEDFNLTNNNDENIIRNLHASYYTTKHVQWKPEAKFNHPTKVIKEFFCHPGWSLEDKLCVKQVFFPPVFLCPKDTHRSGNKCIKISHPELICPHPFELSKGHKHCIFTKTFPAKLICPGHDEFFDEKEGCCKKQIHLPPKCPDHYHWKDEKCVKIFESTLKCPHGFELSHWEKLCIKKFKIKAEIKCPEGSKYYEKHDECISIYHPPPKCPHHLDFDKHLNKCVKRVPKVPLPCPKDWWRHDDKFCETKEKLPAIKYCPKDFEFDEKHEKCKKEIPLPPKCPPGFTKSRAHEHEFCEKLIPEKPICPEGTEPVESSLWKSGEALGFGQKDEYDKLKCKRREEHELSIVCPHGFELIEGAKKCKKVEWYPPKLSCKDDCYVIKEAPALFVCPEGTKFVHLGDDKHHHHHGKEFHGEHDEKHHPSCIREIKGEVCKPPVEKCFYHEENKKELHHHKRRLGGKEEEPECHELPPICKPVKKVEIFPAKPYCPDGGELKGHNICIFKEAIIPKKICHRGELDEHEDRCKYVIYEHAKEKCLHGGHQEGKICVSWEFLPPIYVCPHEAETNENNCCVIKKPLIPGSSYWHFVPLLYKCPDDQVLEHKWCIVTKKIPIDYVCPPGTVEDKHECLIEKDLIFPEPIEKKFPPIRFCHKGTLCDHKWCEIIEKDKAIHECPKHSELIDKKDCIKIKPPIHVPPKWITTSPIPECPDKASIFGTKCIITKKTEPIPTCPHKYEWFKDKCVKKYPGKFVCPDGSFQLDGKHDKECSKLIKSHAKIKIIHGCVFKVDMNCRECKPVEEKCIHE